MPYLYPTAPPEPDKLQAINFISQHSAASTGIDASTILHPRDAKSLQYFHLSFDARD